ncbi:ATP-binding cassette domain-containing protein [Isosphaeraceae bacterium EP7]
MDAIAIRGVSKSFGQTAAVDDLSLTVPRGSLYGFIGPNGSGKTTTLRMIMRILMPDRGEVEVLGETSSRSARDRVAYLPEERGLYKKMAVGRLIRYYARLKGLHGPELDLGVNTWLERMGLADWADKKVDALSKGMAQKVQFIAAVVAKPDVLILDEPFSGLDPVNAEVLKDAILDLKRQGTTIVFSTHDMSVAEQLCDRIFMIFKGKKVLDGSLDEIQELYGYDTLKVRTAAGASVLDEIDLIDGYNDQGNYQEVRTEADPQAVLAALIARTQVLHFEIARPSLRDIFVRIANPEPEGAEIHA